MGKKWPIFLAVAAGNLTFLTRKWQWATAYDPHEQLFLSGSIATPVLFLLLGLIAVCFLLYSRKLKKTWFPKYYPDSSYMMLMTISSFLFFGTGFLGLFQGYHQLQLWQANSQTMVLSYPASLLLCGLLCLLSGGSTLLLGRGLYRSVSSNRIPILAQIPSFTATIWLFAIHMEHASDPVLLDYGMLLATAVFVALASYEFAAYFQGFFQLRRFHFCSYMGIVLSFTVQADTMSWFSRCIATSFLFLTAAQLYLFLPATKATVSSDL